jgi:hypothetical protein
MKKCRGIRYPKRFMAAIEEVREFLTRGGGDFSYRHSFEEPYYVEKFIQHLDREGHGILRRGWATFKDEKVALWKVPNLRPTDEVFLGLINNKEDARSVPHEVGAGAARAEGGVSYEGCAPPVGHFGEGDDPRWYSTGMGHYQGLSEERRARIRINGQAVICPDIKASILTVLMGMYGYRQDGDTGLLAGENIVRFDPYMVDFDLTEGERADVKAVFNRYAGCIQKEKKMYYGWGKFNEVSGKFVKDGEYHSLSVKDYLDLLFNRYPFLKCITRCDVIEALRREARVIQSFCDYETTLPMHDQLITIRGMEIVEELKGKFLEVCEIVPMVKCNPPVTYSEVEGVSWDDIVSGYLQACNAFKIAPNFPHIEGEEGGEGISPNSDHLESVTSHGGRREGSGRPQNEEVLAIMRDGESYNTARIRYYRQLKRNAKYVRMQN